MNIFFLFLILFFCFFNSFSNEIDKICTPKLLQNYKNIKENLKICDPGNRLLLKFSQNLSPDELIINLCDLRFSVIFERERKVINSKSNYLTIVCIYLPSNEMEGKN